LQTLTIAPSIEVVKKRRCFRNRTFVE